ncbi:DNA circularization protein [Acetobacter estunensis]|uniref:DNA circularization protein n=1 Tax=Acetobacter estunensis TaxID=104097 RepID=UPI001C2DB45D|nr:DNA circularization N-terminal domain-containing protein [Acetobacter estunensis]MBV1835660.1 DNA circularization N-terminal domain-containing protein [Acetobacter estunensis]MBV1836079.1 DNA circularization N-terminal domain-containing protein [Acetobacter estunensis]
MSGTLITTAAEYLQCSFRGVPFVVVGSGGTNGRKQAAHDYPGKDGVWVEDLGRAARSWRIRGFTIGALAYTQRDLLSQAAEQAGSGLLMHPSIGLVEAYCMQFEWQEPDGRGNIVSVEFLFVEDVDLLSTLIVTALHAAVAASAIALSAASSSSYQSRTASAFDQGSSVENAARSTASSWAAGAVTAMRSPRAQTAAISVLDGSYGRFVGGNGAETDSSATVESVLASLTTGRAAVSSAVASFSALTGASDIATAAQTLTETLRSNISDPGTQIALLWPLASCEPEIVPSEAPIGAAIATVQTETAALCRRAALASIAEASSEWSASSSTEAQTMAARIVALIAAEEEIAGDAGDDASYEALHDLRCQVAQDLTDRAARLPDVITVTRNACLPALVLGQQLYADATRADELIQWADPVHPAFMPTEFEALSA